MVLHGSWDALEPLCLWPFPHLQIGTSRTQFQGAGLGTRLAALSYFLIRYIFKIRFGIFKANK